MESGEPKQAVVANMPDEKSSAPQVNTSSAAEPIAAILGDEAHHIDPVLEARVLRKIDLFLMPAMLIGTNVTDHFVLADD